MRRAFLSLAAIAPVIAGVVMVQPASCQLPPTNMGKYVHQPGDNQYDRAAQQERHGQPAPVVAPVINQGGGGGGGGGNGWVPTPHIPKPDISLEPIAADEPVVAAGFPPFPDRLDLPVSGGWGRAAGGGSYGGGSGGGAAPGGPPMPTGTHQHYNHYDPGAFVQGKPSSSSNKSNTAPMPMGKADQYNAAGNGGVMNSSGGIEPRLNPAMDHSMPAEAPAAVSIKQSVTQDLSLPDDDFSNKNSKQPSGTSKFMKRTGRQLLQPLNNIGSMAGSGMTSRLRF